MVDTAQQVDKPPVAEPERSPEHEKQRVAVSSVVAAIFLTGLKLVIGVGTGSLGLLAEAAHSGLDLLAALMTLFAVRLADRPADITHQYGHGKIENLSAFFETLLLLATSIWIIYEAIQRLFFHGQEVNASIWAFLVMLISIGVDWTRSRALMRIARKYNSQALEADALHFSTDIWSSLVVLLGLFAIKVGEWTGWPGPWDKADALAALGVSGIVLFISGRMAKDTLAALLDTAPVELVPKLQQTIANVPDVLELRRMRLRRVGSKLFVDAVAGVARTNTFEQTHTITEAIEDAVNRIMPGADVVVHTEPVASPTESAADQIRYLARTQGVRVHDVHVHYIDGRAGKMDADVHVEMDPELPLNEAHEIASRLEDAVLESNPRLSSVHTHLEAPPVATEPRRDVTPAHLDLVEKVRAISDEIAGKGATGKIIVYRVGALGPAEYDLVVDVRFPGDQLLPKVHDQVEEIERALRAEISHLGSVLIHAEPPD